MDKSIRPKTIIHGQYKKSANRLAAERYVRANNKFFAASVTHEDIERAISRVENALNELMLKPVYSKPKKGL